MDTNGKEGERPEQTPTFASDGHANNWAGNIARWFENNGHAVTLPVTGILTGIGIAQGNIGMIIFGGLSTGVSAVGTALKERSMKQENRALKKQVSELQDNQKPKVNE